MHTELGRKIRNALAPFMSCDILHDCVRLLIQLTHRFLLTQKIIHREHALRMSWECAWCSSVEQWSASASVSSNMLRSCLNVLKLKRYFISFHKQNRSNIAAKGERNFSTTSYIFATYLFCAVMWICVLWGLKMCFNCALSIADFYCTQPGLTVLLKC